MDAKRASEVEMDTQELIVCFVFMLLFFISVGQVFVIRIIIAFKFSMEMRCLMMIIIIIEGDDEIMSIMMIEKHPTEMRHLHSP